MLCNLFYPVRGSGSWSHLKEIGIDESEIEGVCQEIRNEISTTKHLIQMDEVEVILCESKDGRLLKKIDLVVKGQSIFKLDENGALSVKYFASHEWVPVDIRFT